MDATIHGLALAPLDSARVVSTVYSLSIVTVVPFAAAGIAALMVRRMPAGTRALVWRATIVALLVIAGAQFVPVRWEAWVLPAALADPLIVLGRHAVRSSAAMGITPSDVPGDGQGGALVVSLLGVVYLAGVAAVSTSIIAAVVAARRLVASASPLADCAWHSAVEEVRQELGIVRPVRLRASVHVAVPTLVGAFHPVVLIPAAMLDLQHPARRAVLLHELAHVRAADVAYRLGMQLVCALLWFHPGPWWVARGLHRESEMACDDRVIAAGTRQSEYALLLANAADHLRQQVAARSMTVPPAAAPAFAGKGALRARLAAITTTGLDRRAPARMTHALALTACLALATPLGLMKLEPTRSVLQSLMQDDRWESRAYAALGLAPRPDSLAVTLHAATSDPSPHVRAWASYALARNALARSAPARNALARSATAPRTIPTEPVSLQD